MKKRLLSVVAAGAVLFISGKAAAAGVSGLTARLASMAEAAAAAASSGDTAATSELLGGIFDGGASLPAPPTLPAAHLTLPAAQEEPSAAAFSKATETEAVFEDGGFLDGSVLEGIMEQVEADYAAEYAPQPQEPATGPGSLFGGALLILVLLLLLTACPALLVAVI